MTPLFNVLLLPFRSLPPMAGLTAVSVLAGAGMVLLFKHTSDQNAVGRLRSRMSALALGMLLHLHSPRVVLRTAGTLLGCNVVYLWTLLRPMMVIAVPFLLTAAQLDARYGRTSIAREPVTVTVTWKALPERPPAITSRGAALPGPVVTLDTLRQTSFPMHSGSPGAVLTLNGTTVPVGASSPGSGGVVHRGAVGMSLPRSWFVPFLDRLPSESPVERIELQLPEARYAVLGGRWSWLAVFLAVSTLSAAALVPVFRVKV